MNVIDIMIAISLALGDPLDEAIDADQNGIVDACQGAGDGGQQRGRPKRDR